MFHWVKIDDLITCKDVRELESNLSVTFRTDDNMLIVGQGWESEIFLDRQVLVAILPFLKHFALTGELPDVD